MADYRIVKLMDTSKKQIQGNAVVALPGGKQCMGVAQRDALAGSGAVHTAPATGVATPPASGANSNWGGSGGQIAAYPTYYQGVNATGLANML